MDTVGKPVYTRHTRICLCVLCGLPAAGKSTLVEALSIHLRKQGWGSFVLSYDELIPDEAYEFRKDYNDDVTHPHSSWKLHRKEVMRCLERFLTGVRAPGAAAELRVVDGDAWARFIDSARRQQVFETSDESSPPLAPPCSAVLLLDDNFYYQSMRYEAYQLARKFSLGYCQLHLQCPVNSCLLRNRARNCPLPDDVIAEMAKRLEPPNPLRNAWEQRSLTLTSTGGFSTDDIQLSFGLFAAALDNPLSPIQDDAEQKETDRLCCASSVVHQADLACRGLVSRAMETARDNKLARGSMQSLASELNQLKARFLDDLRKQALQGFPLGPGDNAESAVRRAVGAFDQETNDTLRKHSAQKTL